MYFVLLLQVQDDVSRLKQDYMKSVERFNIDKARYLDLQGKLFLHLARFDLINELLLMFKICLNFVMLQLQSSQCHYKDRKYENKFYWKTCKY